MSSFDDFFHDYFAIKGLVTDLFGNKKEVKVPKLQVKTTVQVREVLTKEGKVVPLRSVTRVITENKD